MERSVFSETFRESADEMRRRYGNVRGHCLFPSKSGPACHSEFLSRERLHGRGPKVFEDGSLATGGST